MSEKIKKWKLLKEEDISPSKWFPLVVQTIELPNGEIIDDYYISKFKDCVSIVPLTKDGHIIMVRQWRQAIREVTYEFPSGWTENDSPQEAAIKELREEVGIVAHELKSLGKISVSPSKHPMFAHGFLVENAEISEKQILDSTEEGNMEIVSIPIKRFDRMILQGEIISGEEIAFFNIARLRFLESFSRW